MELWKTIRKLKDILEDNFQYIKPMSGTPEVMAQYNLIRTNGFHLIIIGGSAIKYYCRNVETKDLDIIVGLRGDFPYYESWENLSTIGIPKLLWLLNIEKGFDGIYLKVNKEDLRDFLNSRLPERIDLLGGFGVCVPYDDIKDRIKLLRGGKNVFIYVMTKKWIIEMIKRILTLARYSPYHFPEEYVEKYRERLKLLMG